MRIVTLGMALLLAGCAPQVDARLKGCQDAFALKLEKEGSADEFTVGAVTGHFTNVGNGLDELQSGSIRVLGGKDREIVTDMPLMCMVIRGRSYLATLKKD